MNNKPVAWIQTWQNQDGELKRTVNIEQIGKQDIPLYTQEQLEEARKLGMKQERALWNISESTQEFESFDRTASHMAGEYVAHPVKKLSRMDVYELAIESGFMLSTQYGEAEHKLMPVSDGDTLVKFARAILRKAQEK